MTELDRQDYNFGGVGGDAMLIIDSDTAYADVVGFVFTDRLPWYHDTRYRQIIGFDEGENSITVYFFADDGSIANVTVVDA